MLTVDVSFLSFDCFCNWPLYCDRHMCLRIRSESVGLVSFMGILVQSHSLPFLIPPTTVVQMNS